MEKMYLKNTKTDQIVVSGEFVSLKRALEYGTKNNIDMSCLSLPGAKLSKAKLDRARLTASDLSLANLTRSSFVFADLQDANLQGALLEHASFGQVQAERVNLKDADCRYADFENAYLPNAKLYGAILHHANMQYARLDGADLRGANTYCTCFDGANLNGALLDPLLAARLTIVPEGDIIVWKKCRQGVIAKLLVPAQAKRSNSTSRKCRAEYVTTLELFGETEETEEVIKSARSVYHPKTFYTVGETTHCGVWDEDRWTECSGGIHFYLTRLEAERHV